MLSKWTSLPFSWFSSRGFENHVHTYSRRRRRQTQRTTKQQTEPGRFSLPVSLAVSVFLSHAFFITLLRSSAISYIHDICREISTAQKWCEFSSGLTAANRSSWLLNFNERMRRPRREGHDEHLNESATKQQTPLTRKSSPYTFRKHC